MKAVPIATFNELAPATQLCRKLEEAGIQSFIHDESRLERFWFMSEPLAAIHVEVDQPDFLKSRQLLQEWEVTSDVMNEAVLCPECHSSRVEFPQITRKFAMPAVQAVLMAMHIIPREFYCQDCHFTWPKEPPVEPARDILGWRLNSSYWHPEYARTRQRR
ncbi:MAG: hypothetical protein AB1705_21145 [Verrucomicrobiota bacterium]